MGKVILRYLRPRVWLTAHQGDRCRQRGLAVVNVTDGSDVDVVLI